MYCLPQQQDVVVVVAAAAAVPQVWIDVIYSSEHCRLDPINNTAMPEDYATYRKVSRPSTKTAAPRPRQTRPRPCSLLGNRRVKTNTTHVPLTQLATHAST